MRQAQNKVTVAAIQIALSDDPTQNTARVAERIREAASTGAQIILPSELFQGTYFCRTEDERFFERAFSVDKDPSVNQLRELAAELRVVLPVSFFEKAGQAYYNSVALIDADGTVLGTYRKSHIPDGPGYEEKFYFRPGDTGFKVWKTKFATIGVGICWDQWFPESARAMMLLGAELLFYPTAIGSEPANPTLNTKDRWQRAMIGHAVSNVVPVIAANRTGIEENQQFYGHSFIVDPAGEKVAELGSDQEGFILNSFDVNEIRQTRASWGFFRDRRPDLYQVLSTADGSQILK